MNKHVKLEMAALFHCVRPQKVDIHYMGNIDLAQRESRQVYQGVCNQNLPLEVGDFVFLGDPKFKTPT